MSCSANNAQWLDQHRPGTNLGPNLIDWKSSSSKYHLLWFTKLKVTSRAASLQLKRFVRYIPNEAIYPFSVLPCLKLDILNWNIKCFRFLAISGSELAKLKFRDLSQGRMSSYIAPIPELDVPSASGLCAGVAFPGTVLHNQHYILSISRCSKNVNDMSYVFIFLTSLSMSLVSGMNGWLKEKSPKFGTKVTNSKKKILFFFLKPHWDT